MMRKPERPGAAGQKVAVEIMRRRVRAERRREAVEGAAHEAMDEFEKKRKAKEAAAADDAASGSSGGGRLIKFPVNPADRRT